MTTWKKRGMVQLRQGTKLRIMTGE